MDEQLEGSVTKWLKPLQAGDPAAIRAIFTRYFVELRDFCESRLRTLSSRVVDGEDLATETLAAFFESQKTTSRILADREGLQRTLFTIATNKLINHVKSAL